MTDFSEIGVSLLFRTTSCLFPPVFISAIFQILKTKFYAFWIQIYKYISAQNNSVSLGLNSNPKPLPRVFITFVSLFKEYYLIKFIPDRLKKQHFYVF